MKTGVWPVGARGSVATTAMVPAAMVPALTGKTQIVLRPKDKQAENFQPGSGLQVTAASGAQGRARGTHKLFMVFKGGSGDLFTFDAFTVNG